jgi:hypothetical protein
MIVGTGTADAASYGTAFNADLAACCPSLPFGQRPPGPARN